MNKLNEAIESLGKAAELIPNRARIHYNYSLSLRHIGRNEDALSEMIKAHEIDPGEPGIVQSIAIFYIQDKQWEQALPFAEKLVKLVPKAPGPEQMLKRILQAIKAGKEQGE